MTYSFRRVGTHQLLNGALVYSVHCKLLTVQLLNSRLRVKILFYLNGVSFDSNALNKKVLMGVN